MTIDDHQKTRCKGCGGARQNWAKPGRDWCRQHDPELASERSAWGRRRTGKARALPYRSGADVSEAMPSDSAPSYVDGTRLPTVRYIVESALGVFESLGSSRLEVHPLTGKVIRVPALDPQVAQAQVRALAVALAGVQKDREIAFREKMELLKAKNAAEPSAPPMTLEEELAAEASGEAAPH